MKLYLRTVLGVMLVAYPIGDAPAQGQVAFDNLGNRDPSLGATSGGLVFLVHDLLNQDVNFDLAGGAIPNPNAMQPLHT